MEHFKYRQSTHKEFLEHFVSTEVLMLIEW